ncbi:MAG: hypothetical protein RLZZ546_1863 [Bacteroidota bacterium]|jgi:hypothetical protein
MLNQPVLLIIYKRIDTTLKVIDSLRKNGVTKLYIASNWPCNKNEFEIVQNCRKTIEQNIDWNCDVKFLYRKEYLTPKESIPDAINWFFSNEEMGIILEDDCVPNDVFYTFCDHLLNKYKNLSSIGMISGNNFQQDNKNYINPNSYYLSNIFHIWGWATWRDRWLVYGKFPNKFSEIVTILDLLYNSDRKSYRYWFNIYFDVFFNKAPSWDYYWSLSNVCAQRCSIIPQFNLVTNIGFGNDATFTTDINDPNSNLATKEMESVNVDPNELTISKDYDAYTQKHHYLTGGIRQYTKYMVNKLLLLIYEK